MAWPWKLSETSLRFYLTSAAPPLADVGQFPWAAKINDAERKLRMSGRLGLDRKRDYAGTADGFRGDIRVSERQRIIGVILALGVFICSAYLLATSSPWLLVESARLPGLPLGTLIAWAGIVSLPMASFLGFRRFLNRETKPAWVYRSFTICLLLLSTAWASLGTAWQVIGRSIFQIKQTRFGEACSPARFSGHIPSRSLR